MHHANVLIGDRERCLAHIGGMPAPSRVDVMYRTYERFGIDDARALTNAAMMRPVVEPYRTFIIATHALLLEAQNALLKLFEEPNAHTVFYLIIPREDILLPTLRSRLSVLCIEDAHLDGGPFAEFLALTYAERLARITERLAADDLLWARAIIRGFEEYAHTKGSAAHIRESLALTPYSESVGGSKKMLLEHLALTL